MLSYILIGKMDVKLYSHKLVTYDKKVFKVMFFFKVIQSKWTTLDIFLI